MSPSLVEQVVAHIADVDISDIINQLGTSISPDLSLDVLQLFYDHMIIKLSFIFEFENTNMPSVSDFCSEAATVFKLHL